MFGKGEISEHAAQKRFSFEIENVKFYNINDEWLEFMINDLLIHFRHVRYLS